MPQSRPQHARCSAANVGAAAAPGAGTRPTRTARVSAIGEGPGADAAQVEGHRRFTARQSLKAYSGGRQGR